MPNRRYQGKELPQSEFITVDLLPDVRRPRQFNVNIILIVLVAVFFTWLLIYWPLSGRQAQLDSALETNNDLITMRELVNDQISEYRIDPSILEFQDHIDRIEALQTDYESLQTELVATVLQAESNAFFLSFTFNVVEEQMVIRLNLPRAITFQNVRIALLELGYVESATYSSPSSPAGTSRYTAIFTIGVDLDAFKETE